ncbi:MAG: RIP metalloprotease RseP [Planctomycetes bacterium]|nr:RIP metalloprotease RseP [Planctomycetota bacterium]
MSVDLMSLGVSLEAIGNSLLVAFGIGLVVFVHELGHFLCARFVGVHVEVFSLGFGPRLFGFVRNGIDYRFSAVPVGGYVKMAGDVPGECTGHPEELLSRSVGERALIFSGGVIMNVIFGLIAFPIVFSAGVPMLEPRLGGVNPGGPAWKAGLAEGDLVRSVNGHDVLSFEDLALEVALGDPNRTIVRIERNGQELDVPVVPEYNDAYGHPSMQASQPTNYRIRVAPEGPAAQAGLKDGDRLVTIDGKPASAESQRRLESVDDSGVVLEVERDARTIAATVVPRAGDGSRYLLGLMAHANAVVAVRGPFKRVDAPIAVGDVIERVDGTPIRSDLDLLALPARSNRLVRVVREGTAFEVPMLAEFAAALSSDVAIGLSTRSVDGGIPIRVSPRSAAAEAGLTDSDRVVAIGGKSIGRWADLLDAMQDSEGAAVRVEVIAADGTSRAVSISPRLEPIRDFGLELDRSYVERRFAPGAAFVAGLHAARNLARQFYLTLRKMVAREVSTEKNLGGIVAISAVSYHYAQRGVSTLFYFLALLSVHLAFINILPIPLFDGAQLLFLAIEKIKGSPVNDRIMGYAQVVGLVFVLSLLVYVTYNDIQRLLS